MFKIVFWQGFYLTRYVDLDKLSQIDFLLVFDFKCFTKYKNGHQEKSRFQELMLRNFFRSGFLELFVFFLNVYNCQLLRTESFTFFYFVVCKILPKTLKTLGGFAALPARSKKLKLTKSSLFVVSNRLVKTEFLIQRNKIENSKIDHFFLAAYFGKLIFLNFLPIRESQKTIRKNFDKF